MSRGEVDVVDWQRGLGWSVCAVGCGVWPVCGVLGWFGGREWAVEQGAPMCIWILAGVRAGVCLAGWGLAGWLDGVWLAGWGLAVWLDGVWLAGWGLAGWLGGGGVAGRRVAGWLAGWRWAAWVVAV